MAARVTPLILAFLLLAAHFLRRGDWPLVSLSVLAPLLLLVRARWTLWLLQVLAYAGAGVWVYTGLALASHRMAMGAPWGRLVLIMGAVALFTVIAGLLLNTRRVRERYPGG